MIANLFNGAHVKGTDFFITADATNAVDLYNKVDELADIRRTKRFSPAKTAMRASWRYVRQDLSMKGKHIHIHIVTPTDQSGVFKTLNGERITIDENFTFFTPVVKPKTFTEPTIKIVKAADEQAESQSQPA